MIFLLAALIGVAALWFGANQLVFARRRRSDQARRDSLMSASSSELAAMLRDRIETHGWRDLEAGRVALAQAAPWTDARLIEALDALFVAAKEADQRGTREGGRDSWCFDFYDCGFAEMSEALQARLALQRA